MRPAGDPMAQLARALALAGGGDRDLPGAAAALRDPARPRLALFVDQLEELLTLEDAAGRARFAAALRALGEDPRCWIITALRADFFGAFMESELWPEFEYGRCEVTPLRGRDLRDAIVMPAQTAGVVLDAALVERLVADTAAEPGALPLLQATLVELWDAFQRGPGASAANRYLILDDYERLGGEGRTAIATALARRADTALAVLLQYFEHQRYLGFGRVFGTVGSHAPYCAYDYGTKKGCRILDWWYSRNSGIIEFLWQTQHYF
jgi:hypothetical protein